MTFALHLHFIYIAFTSRLHHICITFTLHVHSICITCTLRLHYIQVPFILHWHYINISFALHSVGLHYITFQQYIMPRDFTSIHICANCVSRYLQTDKPVDGQIETCMQYIYTDTYIIYLQISQHWNIFWICREGFSYGWSSCHCKSIRVMLLTSQTSQILAPGTRRSLLGSFHRMSWSQFEVFCLCPIDSTFLGPRQDSWENGMRLQETSRTGPREVASLELMRQNILYPEMLKAGNRL